MIFHGSKRDHERVEKWRVVLQVIYILRHQVIATAQMERPLHLFGLQDWINQGLLFSVGEVVHSCLEYQHYVYYVLSIALNARMGIC